MLATPPPRVAKLAVTELSLPPPMKEWSSETWFLLPPTIAEQSPAATMLLLIPAPIIASSPRRQLFEPATIAPRVAPVITLQLPPTTTERLLLVAFLQPAPINEWVPHALPLSPPAIAA